MRKIIQGTILIVAAASMAMAQAPLPQQAKKAKGITKKEADAFNAIQRAKTPDEKIAAVESFISKFADSQFKAVALNDAAEAADQKRDYNKAIFYGEQAIAADPTDFDPLLLVSGELAQHTREFDLDKAAKLTKANDYAQKAMAMIPNAVKPSALSSISDAQWEAYKKDSLARVHQDLGLIAAAQKKWDVAATEYKASLDAGSEPDSVVMVRLANAYDQLGKPEQAIPVLDQVLALPNLNPAVKNFAQNEKAQAEKSQKAKK
ncbi:MAG TPA: hypothetical protein VFW83_09885 [Bryobacteraceae bacterium]|nr:hypothetical protein [Bryobacteraceae bacterium]